METARRFVADAPTRFEAYLALQCALMQRFVARGGTPEDFCLRLAPVFRRRYAPLLLDADPRALARFQTEVRGWRLRHRSTAASRR